MELTYIIQYCKKYFPNSFEYISRRLKQTEDPEEKTLIFVAANTLVYFSIGTIYNTIIYAFSDVSLLFAVNLLSLVVYATATLMYIGNKSSISTCFAVLLFTAQINISMSIIHNYAASIEQSKFATPYNLFHSFIVCILASIGLRKSKVLTICILPLAAFASILFFESTDFLIGKYLGFCLAYLSPPALLTYTRIFLWDAFRKKERLFAEKKSYYRLMGMNEDQWDLLINVVQKPHTPRRQTEELFERIQDVIGDRLVIRAERLLANEEVMERINEKHNFSLTANEVRLCCLILEDKTIAEISQMLYINESSVRSNRSRIRKKMNLDKKKNLKAYLLMLVGKEKHSYRNKFQEQHDDL